MWRDASAIEGRGYKIMEAGWIGGCLRVTQSVSGMGDLVKYKDGKVRQTGGLENPGLARKTEFLSNLLKPNMYACEYALASPSFRFIAARGPARAENIKLGAAMRRFGCASRRSY
jgi:hypothetical protein